MDTGHAAVMAERCETKTREPQSRKLGLHGQAISRIKSRATTDETRISRHRRRSIIRPSTDMKRMHDSNRKTTNIAHAKTIAFFVHHYFANRPRRHHHGYPGGYGPRGSHGRKMRDKNMGAEEQNTWPSWASDDQRLFEDTRFFCPPFFAKWLCSHQERASGAGKQKSLAPKSEPRESSITTSHLPKRHRSSRDTLNQSVVQDLRDQDFRIFRAVIAFAISRASLATRP